MRLLLIALLLVAALLAYGAFSSPEVAEVAIPESAEAIERGEYLVTAGGCVSCHQGEGEAAGILSGGLRMESDFGSFHVPNITPDPQHGIGNWSGRDFLLAMKHGRSPDGSYYFPAFPYRSYAGLRDEDVLDMAAYLMRQAAVAQPNIRHDLAPWLNRWMMAGWNMLADLQEPDRELPEDPQLARGAYLARHLGHCGECHTPRNALGMLRHDQEFAGGPFEDGYVEGIDREALANWTQEDFEFFLFLGMKPDGEFVGGKMEPVIEHNTSKLTEEDQEAMAAFFTSP